MDRGAWWATVQGLQKVRHDWAHRHTCWRKLHTHMHEHTKREPVRLEVHSSFQQWHQKSLEVVVLWGCVGWTSRKRSKTGVTDVLTCTLGKGHEQILCPKPQPLTSYLPDFAIFLYCFYYHWGFPGGSDGKESAWNAGDLGSIPGLGRSPGGGHGNTLQYSCLENPHGQRSLAGYSSRGWKELDMTEWLSTAQHYYLLINSCKSTNLTLTTFTFENKL